MGTKSSASNRLFVVFGLCLSGLLFQNCTPTHLVGDPSFAGSGGLSSLIPGGGSGASSVQAFSSTLKPVLTTNCGSCHGASQNPKFAVADSQLGHDTLVNSSLVDFGNPANSRIVQKIRGGHNGISTNVSQEMETQIQAWIAAVSAGGGSGGAPGGGLPVATPLEAKFSSISQKILVPKCVGCHGPTLAEEGIRYDSHALTLRTVVPGNAALSLLHNQCNTGQMPPDNTLRLTAEEMDVLGEWINAGALNN